MTTLTTHPHSSDQETAIWIFLDALHADYKDSDDVDDTEYLLSSLANAEHLAKSIDQGDIGNLKEVRLDDIWKE